MKDTESVDEFAGKLSDIASKTAALGEEIEDTKLVKKFLKCLPRKKFVHIVASLEQVLDLKTTTFEDITGRLKAFEERVAEDQDEQEDQSKLMYAHADSQTGEAYRESSGGANRGRGRGGNRGRGRERGNGTRDMSEVECFRCDKFGHYASKCPDRLLKLKLQEAQEDEIEDTEKADKLMMHEVVYLNEKKVVPSKYEEDREDDNVWYLDNGASNHMTGDRRYFSKLDESITGKVRFGDDSRIDIKGKGLIEFIDRNGEARTMADVYFIPDLRSNIISLGQATESGCDVRMKEEFLTMHDAKGKLLVKATRGGNRLYKVRMGIRNTMCLISDAMSESSRWHARLGHVNLDTMKLMVQKKLVVGVPEAARQAWTSLIVIEEFKKEMSSKFEMSDLGRLTYYLGIEVQQDSDGITLSQRRYALKILEEAGMMSCNPVHTPMEAGLKLSKATGEKDIDAMAYRKNVGCLRYLLHTRPDLSYCVGVLSRYMQNPKESHGVAMKQCLRYLRGTTTLGLTFKRSSANATRLVGYNDSSHNVDPDDGKSTTGHVFYLGESLISWCSQKQDTVALSSCEAEFMAGTEAAR
ncbi:unnamed protein product [Microthlaspi erraticum]|uniref:CCHC-type domain-containing protein n=1 Tax=Microthlaspi erraticum TaxID=1685480 RepID=A0A6D2LE01_9BRAS|nr:unnamed protein product [Microthlaspi erraticum]